MEAVVLIADLVDSREIPQRSLFQRKLGRLLARTSAGAANLASPYTLTLGDEFQAVYRKADSVFADIFGIMAEIHPVRVRVSVGVGELATKINSEQALGMDGPVFHQARAALISLKEDERLLRIAGADDRGGILSDHVSNLLSHQIETWSGNRLLILEGLLRGRSVREIEEGLKITRVAIYKNIRAAALDDVAGICHAMTAAMNQLLRA